MTVGTSLDEKPNAPLLKVPLVPDPPKSPPAAAQAPARGALRRVLIPVVATSLAAGLAVFGARGWDQWEINAVDQTTDDAFVAADISTLSARVSGNVKRVGVNDYQTVQAGQLIAEIDPAQFDVAVDLASSSADAARGNLANLANQEKLQAANIAAAMAQHQSAVAQEVETGEEADRQLALGDATTKRALQQAQAAKLQAQAAVAVADADIDQQQAQLGVLKGQESILKAQLDAARAGLENARLQKDYSRIYAPFTGILGARLTHVGDFVGVGTSVISIVPSDGFYVTANFKETQLARMRKGDAAEVRVDTFPGRTFKGKVADMSPASGSVFALLPPDNATGNFTKVVQRVPIKIYLDPGQPLATSLRAGFSATVTVHSSTGEASAP